jgi:hypothetical protein
MRQKAVWWAVAGVDDFGQPEFADPVQVDCRWTQKLKTVLDSQGNEVLANSEVMVDRDMAPGDFLREGVQESDDTNGPLAVGAHEIISWEKIPDLKAQEYVRKAYL